LQEPRTCIPVLGITYDFSADWFQTADLASEGGYDWKNLSGLFYDLSSFI